MNNVRYVAFGVSTKTTDVEVPKRVHYNISNKTDIMSFMLACVSAKNLLDYLQTGTERLITQIDFSQVVRGLNDAELANHINAATYGVAEIHPGWQQACALELLTRLPE